MLKGMCCMRLHTAGMFFGWLGSVCGFLAIIFLSIVLGNADYIAERIAKDSTHQEDVQRLIKVVCSLVLAIDLLSFLSSILLVIGTMKNRHLFLLPWLINSGIFIAISIILNLFNIGALLSRGRIPEGLVALVFSGLMLTMKGYIYYAIFSLFHHIRATNEENRSRVVQNEENHKTTSYPNYVKI